MLAAYRQMGLDAMAIGERDTEAKVDVTHVPGEALVTRAGIRVGVFAADMSDVQPDALAKLIAGRVERLRKRGAKLVVALLHGADASAQKVLESLDATNGIDVAVLAHDVNYSPMVRKFGKTFVVASAPQGKQAGVLDLHVLDGKLVFADAGQRAQLEVNLGDYERQLVDITAREKSSDEKMRPMYEQQKQNVMSMKVNAERQLAASPKVEGSWLEGRSIPLGTDIPDEPRVAELIAKYKVEIAKLMPVAPTLTNAAVNSAGNAYAGVARCGSCHAPALAFWKKTKHARAWKTLVDQKQDKNPACINCHITGNMVSMPDVQCEACHGAAAAHTTQIGVAGLVRKDVPAAVCLTCHTPNQGAFELTSFRAAILGKGHGVK